MALVPIQMPQLGESIAEATVIRLGFNVGDTVRADQEIIEVETNKAVMGVTTLCNGIVSEIKAQEGISYSVGTLLGLLWFVFADLNQGFNHPIKGVDIIIPNNQHVPGTIQYINFKFLLKKWIVEWHND